MATCLVTDAYRRMTLPLIRDLGEAGYQVKAVSEEGKGISVGALSRFSGSGELLPRQDARSLARLCEELLTRDGTPPVLFCVGGETMADVAQNRVLFQDRARLLLADPAALELLNDKRAAAQAARRAGVQVPREYARPEDADCPCVVKYVCGEKLGKQAAQRYQIARTPGELEDAYRRFLEEDDRPILQQYVEGAGFGACLLMDRESRPVDFLCHRRVREYPASGGPSSCCEAIHAPKLARAAARLLQSVNYVGPAMVEFKGPDPDHAVMLEVNPRVWGTYALTRVAESGFTLSWLRAARGEKLPECDFDRPQYRVGRRMKYVPTQAKALLVLLRRGQVGEGLRAAGELFSPRIPDGIWDRRDRPGSFGYYRSLLGR